MKEVGWAQVVPASQLYVVDLFPTHWKEKKKEEPRYNSNKLCKRSLCKNITKLDWKVLRKT